MKSSEVYKPVPHELTPGITYSIDQDVVANPPSSPFKEGHLDCFSVVGRENLRPGKLSRNQEEMKLIKISPEHGRSYEINFGKTGGIFWKDEYDNLFYGVTTKGNNFTDPYVRRSTSGYEVYGLQDSNTIARVLRVSQILRSRQIDTEFILRIVEPTKVPFNGRSAKLTTLKRKLIQQAADRGLPQERTRQYIENTTFLIITRAMQVPERLRDLAEAPDKETLLEMTRRVFVFVNFSEEKKAEKDPSYQPYHFDTESEEDLYKYFLEYLPGEIGTNYGRLHQLELVHEYANSGNISAAGGIHDLDSVWGETLGLGDQPVSAQRLDDEFAAVNYTYTVGEAVKNIFETLNFDQREASLIFQRNLYSRYITERGSREFLLGNIHKLCELHNYFRGEFENSFEPFAAVLAGQVGWSYQQPEDAGTLRDLYEKDAYPSSFYDFIAGRIYDSMGKERESELAEFEERYGKDNTDALKRIMSYREARRIAANRGKV